MLIPNKQHKFTQLLFKFKIKNDILNFTLHKSAIMLTICILACKLYTAKLESYVHYTFIIGITLLNNNNYNDFLNLLFRKF